MPLLRLNLVEGQLQCPEIADDALPNHISGHLQSLDRRAPIVILLHGYRYSPRCRYRDAHKLIFAERHRTDRPRRISVSWPSSLGYAPETGGPGLCLPISWDARGGLRDVYCRAEEAGRQLAELLDHLAELDPLRPVHLMAHSLGARVALTAVAEAQSPLVRKLILLAPAAFRSQAIRALTSRGGAEMEVLQVSPAENRVFDLLLSRALGTGRSDGPTLGRAEILAVNWVRLGVDTEEDLAHLGDLGFVIGARTSRVCHWSAYLRPGLMSLYSACLSGAGIESFSSLARTS